MDLTGLQALKQIMTIYGDTNSLEGTYDLFLIIKQDLERLEVLEALVYTNQLESTADIENEFGRSFTILQNHCMAMEDTLYASKVLIKLINKYEKLKKAIEVFKRFKNEYEEHGQGYYHLLEYTKSYYELVIDSNIELSQQEYELLKEVIK